MSDPRPYAELLAKARGHMSFAMTMPQLLNGTKTVTRRPGWRRLQVGAVVRAVPKSQVGKGQTMDVVGVILVLGVRRERVDVIQQDDVVREGFPSMDRFAFIRFFCKATGRHPFDDITRIEFEFTRAPSRQLGLFP